MSLTCVCVRRYTVRAVAELHRARFYCNYGSGPNSNAVQLDVRGAYMYEYRHYMTLEIRAIVGGPERRSAQESTHTRTRTSTLNCVATLFSSAADPLVRDRSARACARLRGPRDTLL